MVTMSPAQLGYCIYPFADDVKSMDTLALGTTEE